MRHVFIAISLCIVVILSGCGEQPTPVQPAITQPVPAQATPAQPDFKQPATTQATPAQSNPVAIPIPKYDKPASVPSPDPLPTSPSLEGKR